MRAERQQQAWNELELGPRWVSRRPAARTGWLLVGCASDESDESDESGPPGATEAAEQPFAGERGLLLDQMLASIGMTRDVDVTVIDLPRSGSPGHGDLHRRIEALQPALILLLGPAAVHRVLETDAELDGLRQQVHHCQGRHQGVPVICSYDPAHLLRHPPDKRKSWEDLCLALDTLDTLGALAAVSPG